MSKETGTKCFITGKINASMPFSVVIPLYNKAAYIDRALRSVLDQSHSELEVMVVDDGSTDEGPELVTEYKDDRVRLLRQSNSGVSAARNRGIVEARSELVAFLDADDQWRPDFLEAISSMTRAYPGAGIYATSYLIRSQHGVSKEPRFNYIPPSPWEGVLPSYFRAAAHGEPPIWTSAACVPKAVFEKVGMFTVGKRMGEDIDMWGRIALRYPVVFTTKTCAIYHHDAQNRACFLFNEEDEHPFVKTIENHIATDKVDEALLRDLLSYRTKLMLENARQHVLNGRYRRAQVLATMCPTREFFGRRLLWGSRINRMTHTAWKICYPNRIGM